jgi:signal transduction histidine kinase
VGLVGLANKSSDFTEQDAQMALAFSEIASIALINSRTLEKLEANERLLKENSERLEELVEEKTKELRDAERLVTIGQTAGMVGHDIRNPLQAITSDVYLAKSELASIADCEAKEYALESLEEIEKNVAYINKIVGDLQYYAKKLSPLMQSTNLEEIVEAALYKREIPEKIVASCYVEENARTILSDPDFIKRILSNLVGNAVQAMPYGGRLFVNAFMEGEDVVITVEDTGEGIPADVKPKLFTPLFTTKSKGQGFGLAVVKRLTEALGGTVTFESILGNGTKFIIRLPNKKQ